MRKEIPRLRMFAGPNGSGKSTLKSMIRQELLGIYVNPDEIEKKIREYDFLDLEAYGITTNKQEVLDFFTKSALLKEKSSLDDLHSLRFNDGKLIFRDVMPNPYFPSVVSDFLYNKLIASGKSFTFETVMSFSSKIDLLRKAQDKGYRTYLYYIATEDPDINISRVHHRVKMGGHPVPKDKIVSRYKRSLDLLMDAVQSTHRAYIFDNSVADTPLWLAEITNGKTLEMKTAHMPTWFKKALWDKFRSEAILS
ncbi:MAG: hypothetical protein HY860_04530 [Chlamydiales bacterium]|nr:hypothetical protein [Chlamydiales bacterium]